MKERRGEGERETQSILTLPLPLDPCKIYSGMLPFSLKVGVNELFTTGFSFSFHEIHE